MINSPSEDAVAAFSLSVTLKSAQFLKFEL